MKKNHLLILILMVATYIINAQSGVSTIDSVKVKYKHNKLPGVGNSIGSMKVFAEATFLVNTNTDKVIFEIIDNGTSQPVYSVEYPLNTSIIKDGTGKIIYQKVANRVFIFSNMSITLKPYTIQVFTKDNQGNSSNIVSIIQ